MQRCLLEKWELIYQMNVWHLRLFLIIIQPLSVLRLPENESRKHQVKVPATLFLLIPISSWFLYLSYFGQLMINFPLYIIARTEASSVDVLLKSSHFQISTIHLSMRVISTCVFNWNHLFRKATGIKEASSIASSRTSWFKEGTSRLEMALEVTPSLSFSFAKLKPKH